MEYENFPLTEALPLLESIFPSDIELIDRASNTGTQTRLTRLISTSPTLPFISPCLTLLKATIGDMYVHHKGKDWLAGKVEEMLEIGLTYVKYIDAETEETLAFISFVLTTDDDELLLYLYEIHVNPRFHGQKLGERLMSSFHEVAESLKRGVVELSDIDVTKVVGTKLTVFPENRALGWYKKLGYEFSEDSPRDKNLRNGKVLKPDYYNMIRLLE